MNILKKKQDFFYVEVKIQSYGKVRIAQKERGFTIPYKDRSVILEEGKLEEQRFTFKPNFISGVGLHQILN